MPLPQNVQLAEPHGVESQVAEAELHPAKTPRLPVSGQLSSDLQLKIFMLQIPVMETPRRIILSVEAQRILIINSSKCNPQELGNSTE